MRNWGWRVDGRDRQTVMVQKNRKKPSNAQKYLQSQTKIPILHFHSILILSQLF